MAINETIVTGRKFRKLIDLVNKTWQRISFWTHSSDVEFTDGKTAETKVGAIDGITDSLVSTSSRIAASAKAVSMLSNDLMYRYIEFADGCITMKIPNGETEHNWHSYNIPLKIWGMNTDMDMFSY